MAHCLPALLASFGSRMASTTNRVMKPSEWQQLGLAFRREKALQTKWQPARGAGCARSSTASGGGRKISLDIPFYRTFPQQRRLLLSCPSKTPNPPKSRGPPGSRAEPPLVRMGVCCLRPSRFNTIQISEFRTAILRGDLTIHRATLRY